MTMNKKGYNLTMMVIAMLAGIAIITLAMFSMTSLDDDIPASPQNDSGVYAGSLGNISNLNNSMNSLILEPLSYKNPLGLLDIAYNAAVGVVTTAVIGVQAIGILLQIPNVLFAIFAQMQIAFAGLGPSGTIVFTFAFAALAFYIVMKVIQAKRGTLEPA